MSHEREYPVMIKIDHSPRMVDHAGRRTRLQAGDEIIVSFDPNDINLCVRICFARNGQALEFKNVLFPAIGSSFPFFRKTTPFERWLPTFLRGYSHGGASKIPAFQFANFIATTHGLKIGRETYSPDEESFQLDEP